MSDIEDSTKHDEIRSSCHERLRFSRAVPREFVDRGLPEICTACVETDLREASRAILEEGSAHDVRIHRVFFFVLVHPYRRRLFVVVYEENDLKITYYSAGKVSVLFRACRFALEVCLYLVRRENATGRLCISLWLKNTLLRENCRRPFSFAQSNCSVQFG